MYPSFRPLFGKKLFPLNHVVRRIANVVSNHCIFARGTEKLGYHWSSCHLSVFSHNEAEIC